MFKSALICDICGSFFFTAFFQPLITQIPADEIDYSFRNEKLCYLTTAIIPLFLVQSFRMDYKGALSGVPLLE